MYMYVFIIHHIGGGHYDQEEEWFSHHDKEWHKAFVPWDHYRNDIVLYDHDSPITWSYFMDLADHIIKGLYFIW